MFVHFSQDVDIVVIRILIAISLWNIHPAINISASFPEDMYELLASLLVKDTACLDNVVRELLLTYCSVGTVKCNNHIIPKIPSFDCRNFKTKIVVSLQ